MTRFSPKVAVLNLLFRDRRLRYVSTAVKELKSYMYGMIRDRKQEIKSGETSSTVRRDLFNQLITASLEEESAMEKTPGSQGLTDEELVGSVTVPMLVERLL
jgi:cytochrome P450